jgi:hypothetical protein
MFMLTSSDRRGKRSDATLQAIDARNRLLSEAASRHFAGQSSRSAANGLRRALCDIGKARGVVIA